MGHSLLNWGSYAHIHLQPVLCNQTTHITFIFLMFLKSTSDMIPSLWISWLLLCVFDPYILFISNPSPIILKRSHRLCPNWKRLERWCHCKFHYCIVSCCSCLPRHRSPRLDGSLFPSPHCTKHWN